MILLILPVLFPRTTICEDRPAEDLVRHFVQARTQTMQENATPADIEKALADCAESLVYEHPAANAKVEGKEKVRAAMAGYLGDTKDARFSMHILASRPNVVVAEVDQAFLAKQVDGNWKPGKRSNITVFEIKDGKIGRILDY